MANYIVSYDLNGNVPTHDEMDKHMKKAGWLYARILETVWYIGTSKNKDEVFDYIKQILSKNDRLIVVRGRGGKFRKLLVKSKSFKRAWKDNV